MERFAPIILEVWREACRHIHIEESVARIAPAIAHRLPLAALVVRRLDEGRHAWETVAAEIAGGIQPARIGDACEPARWPELVEWCRRQEVVHAPAAEIARDLPGLIPEGVGGDVLAGGLSHEGRPIGALLLVAPEAEPFKPQHEPLAAALLEPLAVALENDRRLHELGTLREAAEADKRSLLTRLGRQDIADTIVGAESGLAEVMRRVEQVARSDTPVLILGETGTGKEVVARAVHRRSRRAPGPFLRANCGAIPAELIDSELFGHERGSFTGAVAQRKGWFERADGGTLFLDEVGELPLAAQVRLLRILQDGTFQRVGGQRQLAVDVRVVAATNRDLHAMVGDGRFREDLWYRLAVFPIRLPALRERPEDIASLAAHFALRAAERLGLPARIPTLEDDALLTAYPWPGNVRELASVIERAAILGDGKRLEVATALGATSPAPLLTPAGRQPDAFETLDAAMARHVEAALARTAGRVEGARGAARLLGINPHTLRARMRKLGIDWQRFRG